MCFTCFIINVSGGHLTIFRPVAPKRLARAQKWFLGVCKLPFGAIAAAHNEFDWMSAKIVKLSSEVFRLAQTVDELLVFVISHCHFSFGEWQYFSNILMTCFYVLWDPSHKIVIVQNFKIVYEWSHWFRLVETDTWHCQGYSAGTDLIKLSWWMRSKHCKTKVCRL